MAAVTPGISMATGWNRAGALGRACWGAGPCSLLANCGATRRAFASGAAAMAALKTHLPGYVEKAGQLKGKGVEIIACLSVNDIFVMNEWGKAHQAEGKVRMLADPTGAFGKATNLLLDKDSLRQLFGTNRSKRFSMVVEDSMVKSLNVEEDGTGLTCSLASNIVSQL